MIPRLWRGIIGPSNPVDCTLFFAAIILLSTSSNQCHPTAVGAVIGTLRALREILQEFIGFVAGSSGRYMAELIAYFYQIN